jgi:hypothetical protein
MAHIAGVRKGKNDVRHTTKYGLDRRYLRSIYSGKDFSRLRFRSSVRPQSDQIGSKQRGNRIAQARANYVRESRQQPTGPEKVYYDRVGVLHYDRAWPEQGKTKKNVGGLIRVLDTRYADRPTESSKRADWEYLPNWVADRATRMVPRCGT